MYKWELIHSTLTTHKDGIKCRALAKELKLNYNCLSGQLSRMKKDGRVRHEKGTSLWYAAAIHTFVNEIKKFIDDLWTEGSQCWFEGYFSALADQNLINEWEFDELIDYIKGRGRSQ